MEEVHHNHKDVVWGWFAVLIALLNVVRRLRVAYAAEAAQGKQGVIGYGDVRDGLSARDRS